MWRRAQLIPVVWDPQPAEFQLQITGDAQSGYTIGGVVRRDGRAHAFTEVLFVTAALIVWRPTAPNGSARLAAFDTGGADRWMTGLLDIGTVTVPAEQAATLLETLVTSDPSRLECPDELRVDARVEPPQPCIRITRATDYRGYALPGARLDARVSFTYGDCDVDAWSVQPVYFDRERRLAWRRDLAAERAALARLQALGVRRVADWHTGGIKLDLADSLLPAIVPVLISEGWRVEAEGRLYRRAGKVTLDVRSGVDWFELHGDVDFGGISADLPTLLAAARRGETFVPLGDGTFGQLPEDWLARAGRMAAIGTPQAGHVRFATCQGALLDAWLSTEPDVSCDETFARARGEVARFEGVAAVDPPPTFRGVLRDYQRDALGWFEFLRRFGFGGCLADEMGLGKTVMVLAAMEARRIEREQAGRPLRPSLIVVPKSLVFNWKQEASRFAPALRVLDFTGGGRRDVLDLVAEHDIVLTTYGTLRRDIGHLKEIAFDYAILDEAQAIKNARTSSAKAARLLKADHRLALSGTPIENHLGELWSLFDFLNPGMLGTASFFAAASATSRTADDGMLDVLARGLRPFILRRTKEQVASELPARTEQTLYCDLEPPQRKLYDELRDHYRAALLGKVTPEGLGRCEAADPRSPATPAPGGVSPRPCRSRAGRRRLGQARRPRAAAPGARGGRPQGARVLSVHDAARPAADAARRGEPDLRVSRREDTRSAGPRAEVSREQLSAVPHQPEGGGPRPQPHRGRVRVSARSRGGIPPSRPRRSTARTASGRRDRCLPSVSSRAIPSRRRSSSCRPRSDRWQRPSSAPTRASSAICGGRIWSCCCRDEAVGQFESVPTTIMSPVGAGTPPAGSSVTATVPTREALPWAPSAMARPSGCRSSSAALIGAPPGGMTQSW